jgi:hypothetical protein
MNSNQWSVPLPLTEKGQKQHLSSNVQPLPSESLQNEEQAGQVRSSQRELRSWLKQHDCETMPSETIYCCSFWSSQREQVLQFLLV